MRGRRTGALLLACALIASCAGVKSGEQLPAPGVYSIQAQTDSSMLRVIECRLTVTPGSMTVFMTLSGQGYGQMFLGSAEDAGKAPGSAVIPYGERPGDGLHTYEFTVPALDRAIPLAAMGLKKSVWYDHTIKFDSSTLAPWSGNAGVLPDGTYTVPVTLSGGSGKASVTSPAVLSVSGGTMTASLVWSSPNYILMKSAGIEYAPVNGDGNSAFEIPVILDADMEVSATTVAMGDPREISYTLRFDSAGVKETGR